MAAQPSRRHTHATSQIAHNVHPTSLSLEHLQVCMCPFANRAVHGAQCSHLQQRIVRSPSFSSLALLIVFAPPRFRLAQHHFQTSVHAHRCDQSLGLSHGCTSLVFGPGSFHIPHEHRYKTCAVICTRADTHKFKHMCNGFGNRIVIVSSEATLRIRKGQLVERWPRSEDHCVI